MGSTTGMRNIVVNIPDRVESVDQFASFEGT
jgi:hypothetical protein